MTKKLLIFSTLFLFFHITVFAQKEVINSKLASVENTLLASKASIDTAVVTYNIIDRMDHYKVPSVSIALINNGEIEWAKAYGYADLKTKMLADTNTIYQAASVSKSVNTLCVMKLVQEGKLSLDKDIRNYLKTWELPENEFSTGRKITLRHLLSHTGGFSTSGFKGYLKKEKIPTINQTLNGEYPANNEAVRTTFPENSGFNYSGGGTTIIRKILEDNISSNYENLLETIVLNPLNMVNSTFSQPLPNKWKSFATAYDYESKEFQDKYYIYPELAADGLWSTPADIAKVVISIQQSLKNKPGTLLTHHTAKEMLTPVLDEFALGTFIIEKGGEKYFTHLGGNLGYKSAYYGSFTTGKGIVILTNSDNGLPLINEIINRVAEVYDWKDFQIPIKL